MRSHILSRILLGTLLAWMVLRSGLPGPQVLSSAPAEPRASLDLTPRLWLPLVVRSAGSGAEWSQHAHDPQHTAYTDQVVAYPWRWRWAWNGPNASGGVSKVTSNGRLPRNVQPVTGGGRVYVAAGSDGVFALREDNGQQLWQRSGIGTINSTVAYDQDTQTVFVVSANGNLYRLNASTGAILSIFSTDSASSLPLPPAVLGDRVLFSMGNYVYAIDKYTMQQLWAYNAQSPVETPPAYSATRNVVIVGTYDLHVHAIRNSDGTQLWRVKPLPASRIPGDPASSGNNNYASFRYGWPVVADGAGYALIKVWLDWGRLWRDWPQTNAAMRALLTNNPGDQALFVLDLDNGGVPYIANVGHGGYGDNNYLPMGPQPVVKRLPNGKEVVYIVIRARHDPYDSRWDSHFGEMVLDGTTVSGLQGGDVRFIAFDWPPGNSNPYLITDEQPNVSMAGDYLFGAHWEAGFTLRILDRSDARGSFTNKITTQRLATIISSQQQTGACAFSASRYCASGLYDTRPYDFGFYLYYNQGAVYDQYWSGYATWVISNDNLYWRSVDGAIVALTSGNPTAGVSAAISDAPPLVSTPQPADIRPVAVIPHTEARAWAGHMVTVTGTLQYVFNNGKEVLLGFSNPHRGGFKVLIRQAHWDAFGGKPEVLYRVGQIVSVVGTIAWYQGDPAIFATTPDQITASE